MSKSNSLQERLFSLSSAPNRIEYGDSESLLLKLQDCIFFQTDKYALMGFSKENVNNCLKFLNVIMW